MWIFSKNKEYLVDGLEGLVDMHNHLLPGIDDGPKTIENSIGLVKGLKEFGVENYICTPHIMHNYYDNNLETITNAHSKLKGELNRIGLDEINISFSAEHMIDEEFESLVEKEKIIKMGQEYILVEMSYLQPSLNFETAISKVKRIGIFPILAHPERYVYLNRDNMIYQYYKSLGIKFQLNMLSLGNYYGKEVKKMAYKLLKANMYDFIGSDVHHIGHINAMKKIYLDKNDMPKIKHLMLNNISIQKI